jgi:ABC-type nitrate/sulfonate/bicarbonate transport system substrate-binding protein
MRQGSWRHLCVAALAGATMLVAGCGGDDESSSSSADGASAKSLRVGYASQRDPNDMADQMGLEAVGAKITDLTEDSAVVAGLIRGDLDVGNIGLTEAVKARQSGAPIKIIYVAQKRFEFVMVSQPEIKGLDDLAGKRVAYHAPGSGTEILPRTLVRQHDPALEDKIKWVVLPESPNRAAAMKARRIDATALEFADVLTLQEEGDFNIIGRWGDITGPSADAISTVWVTTDKFAAENQDQLKSFVTELQKGYDKFYEDKQGWIDFTNEHLPDVGADRLPKTYDFYKEQEMYPVADQPPITPELWGQLNDFFTQIGEYDDPQKDDMVDYGILNTPSGG